MAIVVAVQTAFPAFAADTDISELFGIFTDGKADFYDGLEFGDNDWAALCHIRLYGTEGAEEYLSSVSSESERLMASEGFVKPTELQRAAIVLSAAGECSEELINAAVYCNDKLERQGLNAYIWALIAANCYGGEAPVDALNTEDTLTQYLLSRQLSDGGFSLKGTAADADMTAAVIYALAPLSESEDVAGALGRAVRCLRDIQFDNGGYTSMGIENCESAAQAVVALAAAGYGEDDADVAAALAAIASYKTEGGYKHIADGGANGTASVQVLLALTSLELQKNGRSLYSTSAEAELPAEETTPPVLSDSSEGASLSEPEGSISGGTLKLIMGGVLMISGVALAVVLLIRRKKSLLILPALLCAAGIAVLLLDISTPEEYYSAAAAGSMQVTVSVDCSAALGYDTSVQLPENGVMMSQQVELPEDATAFDALIEAARTQQLRVDYTGGAFGEYVSGIGGLSEFDCGSESGWLYEVNGVRPSVSAGAYVLAAGDEVTFVYTCTAGTAS